MGYIYKITNDFDERIYIGKTSRTLGTRFYEHLRDGLIQANQSYINSSMAKHGKEHFSYEILEECNNDILNEREKYWINYYHSYVNDPLCNGRGYNLTPGGDGRSLSDEQINAIRKLWIKGLTISEISEQLNISRFTIYHRVCKYDDFDLDNNRYIRSVKNIVKHINCYDEKGNLLKTYYSIASAGRELNLNHNSISSALKYHYKLHNYYFSYFDEELIINTSKKAVLQFDLEGKLVNSFDGAREAARNTGCDSGSIIKVCNGQHNSSKGYIFIYSEDYNEELLIEKIQKAKKTSRYRKKEFQ